MGDQKKFQSVLKSAQKFTDEIGEKTGVTLMAMNNRFAVIQLPYLPKGNAPEPAGEVQDEYRLAKLSLGTYLMAAWQEKKPVNVSKFLQKAREKGWLQKYEGPICVTTAEKYGDTIAGIMYEMTGSQVSTGGIRMLMQMCSEQLMQKSVLGDHIYKEEEKEWKRIKEWFPRASSRVRFSFSAMKEEIRRSLEEHWLKESLSPGAIMQYEDLMNKVLQSMSVES